MIEIDNPTTETILNWVGIILFLTAIIDLGYSKLTGGKYHGICKTLFEMVSGLFKKKE